MYRVKAPPTGSVSKSHHGKVLVSQSAQGDKTRRTSNVRNNESVEVFIHRSGQQLSQRAIVFVVSTLHSLQVSRALTFQDDHRRVSKPDQDEVQKKTPCTPIAIQERVHLLETIVDLGEALGPWDWHLPTSEFLSVGINEANPLFDGGRDKWPKLGCHATLERLNVMLTEVSRRCGIGGHWVWGNCPHRAHRPVVNLPDLVNADNPFGAPATGFKSLPIDPLRGSTVSLNFHVLTKRLGSNSTSILQESLNLPQNESVAFQGSGMVRFKVPISDQM
nr:hypothetical protein [Nesterenkonia muleiensis]